MEDKRFKHAVSDARFRNAPRKDRKVKIDKRFQSMFTDKRFQTKFAVDERGRPVNEFQSDNYKKYYDLSSSSDESEVENEDSSECEDDIDDSKETYENNENLSKNDDIENGSNLGLEDAHEANANYTREKLKEAKKEVNKYIDEIHKSKLNSKIRDKLTDFRVDYARGIGTLISESSSDESSSDESDFVNIEHPWGELDKDAEETNEISPRLAVCNMDWDRVTAKDLMVLFHSFLPPDGIIESITIYPSEFGMARMAEEELKGPKELVEMNDKSSDIKEPDEAEEGNSYQREKLREYQLKRLKYYYAVIVCNTKETANTLYTECDGLEYESSAMKLDLRFIPDDVTFEQKPHDQCTALPDLKKYKPRLFVNTALQQGKVDLTWDETDPNRIDISRRLLAGEEVDEDDLQAYVANSLSEEEEEENEDIESDECTDNKDESRIKKYRDLVTSLQEKSNKERTEVEMEVSWGVDVNDKGNKQTEDETGEIKEESCEDSENGDELKVKKSTQSRKKNKKISRPNEAQSSEEKQQNAELELLLADDDPAESGLKHFSLKEIQKKEKQQQKKKKWQKKKRPNYEEEDLFKINATDERFSAIFSSHQFNIDPADPHFRKTKGMEQLIAEKQKRRKLEA